MPPLSQTKTPTCARPFNIERQSSARAGQYIMSNNVSGGRNKSCIDNATNPNGTAALSCSRFGTYLASTNTIQSPTSHRYRTAYSHSASRPCSYLPQHVTTSSGNSLYSRQQKQRVVPRYTSHVGARRYSPISCSLQIDSITSTDISPTSSLRMPFVVYTAHLLGSPWAGPLNAPCGLGKWLRGCRRFFGTGPSPLFPFRNVVDCRRHGSGNSRVCLRVPDGYSARNIKPYFC